MTDQRTSDIDPELSNNGIERDPGKAARTRPHRSDSCETLGVETGGWI